MINEGNCTADYFRICIINQPLTTFVMRSGNGSTGSSDAHSLNHGLKVSVMDVSTVTQCIDCFVCVKVCNSIANCSHSCLYTEIT